MLPLGVYGLVTAVYEDSFDRAMETIPRARGIVGDDVCELWRIKHEKEDLAAIDGAVETISEFAEFAARLEADPALAQAWKRQGASLANGFWTRMALGTPSLHPSFFTPDEIALPTNRMEQRFWSKPWSLSRYLVFLAVLNFVICVREALDEIVSPQRVTEAIEGLKVLGQSCLESDDEGMRSLVPAVQVAIDDLLEAEAPSRSKAIQILYLQGLLRALSDTDTLGPHWRRFLKRLGKRRLFWRLSGVNP